MTPEAIKKSLGQTEREIVWLKKYLIERHGRKDVQWPEEKRRRLAELKSQAKNYRALLTEKTDELSR